MKLLMEHYGAAVIAILVALTLAGMWQKLSFLGAEGVPEIVGEIITGALQKKEAVSGNGEAFITYKGEVMPELVVSNSYAFQVNDERLIQDGLMAVYPPDAEEQGSVSLRVLEAWSADELKTPAILTNRGYFIKFPRRGVYWVRVKISTESGKTAEKMLQIFVNEERME